jgi:hypothetical protein
VRFCQFGRVGSVYNHNTSITQLFLTSPLPESQSPHGVADTSDAYANRFGMRIPFSMVILHPPKNTLQLPAHNCSLYFQNDPPPPARLRRPI